MDAVIGMVLKSAQRLGLNPESSIVADAMEAAKIAVQEGRGDETAAELARSILLRATQPILAA